MTKSPTAPLEMSSTQIPLPVTTLSIVDQTAVTGTTQITTATTQSVRK